jgi:glucose/arabinose dehydrogenase
MTARISLIVVTIGAALVAVSAVSAQGPPLPKASNGAQVQRIATGVPTPSVIAFGKGRIFVGGFGEEDGTGGGIFVLRGGKPVKIPGTGSPAGLAWKNGTLYASEGPRFRLVAYSGWNGTRFAKKRVVFSGPKGFPGLNGIAIGWDGRLYAGVSLTADHRKSKRPFAQSVISMRLDGTDVRTVSTGFRQPWQLAFVHGVRRPYVTELGQENLGRKQPPDSVVLARDGADYGFPTCNWGKPVKCSSFTKPLALLPAHSSPTGIAAQGTTLYVGMFNGTGHGPEVISLSSTGGRWHPVVTGFAAPVVAIAFSGGNLYVGDLTGSIYRVDV